MNWSRTKTWLIVLFVGINLFLLFTIAKENIAQSTISEQMITDTVSILSRNGITVDPEIIPRKMPSLSSMEVINTITDPVKTAESMLGGAATYDEDGRQYLRSTSIVRIDGDTVSYININPAQRNIFEDEQGAIEFAKSFLTESGFDMTKAQAQVLSYTASEMDIQFTQKLDSYPLMDSQFVVSVSTKGISKADGCWFYMAEDQSAGSGAHGRVKEITSVLIDFVNDGIRAGSSTEIIDITLGYTTGDKSTYHKAVSAMPSWRITTSDGRVYYYDAN